MHHKAIKAQIRKQLKIRYPNWHRLTKKEKKTIAKKVLDCSRSNYFYYNGHPAIGISRHTKNKESKTEAGKTAISFINL